jgi:hypothetical protein
VVEVVVVHYQMDIYCAVVHSFEEGEGVQHHMMEKA